MDVGTIPKFKIFCCIFGCYIRIFNWVIVSKQLHKDYYNESNTSFADFVKDKQQRQAFSYSFEQLEKSKSSFVKFFTNSKYNFITDELINSMLGLIIQENIDFFSKVYDNLNEE